MRQGTKKESEMVSSIVYRFVWSQLGIWKNVCNVSNANYHKIITLLSRQVLVTFDTELLPTVRLQKNCHLSNGEYEAQARFAVKSIVKINANDVNTCILKSIKFDCSRKKGQY